MIIASIDIGTNTVILLIAKVDIDKKEIIPVYNEQRIPRIGKGVSERKIISENKVRELFVILEDYNKIIKKSGCSKVLLKATNAFRIALNGKEILERIKSNFNFEAEIVPGEKEAKLSFQGAVNDEKQNENFIVIDIGGGSTEVIYGNKKEIFYNKSFPAGVVSGSEKCFFNDPPKSNEITNFLNKLEKIFTGLEKENFNTKNAIAIAGTPTTLGAIKLNLKEYNEEKLEGIFLSKNEIDEMIDQISKISSRQIASRFKSVVKGREDVILSGALILSFLMQILRIEKIKVSTKGIRYGAIVEKLSLF